MLNDKLKTNLFDDWTEKISCQSQRAKLRTYDPQITFRNSLRM